MKKTQLRMWFGGFLVLIVQQVTASSDIPVYGTAPAVATPKTGINAERMKAAAPKKLPAKPAAEKPLPPPSKTTMNLINAIRAGNFEMAELLLSQGGDINCRNCNYRGAPPLMELYNHDRGHNSNARLAWMLKHGADPNLGNKEGQTLLMDLVGWRITNPYYSGIDDFLYLLKHGARADATDNQGNTVLHYISSEAHGDPDVMSRSGHGDSAYDSFKQWVLAFDKLIENGANINSTNRYGETPLMKVVAHTCNPKIVHMYLAARADAAKQSRTGQTALSIAIDVASNNASMNCNKVVQILKQPSSVTIENPASAIETTAATAQDKGNGNTTEWSGTFRATSPRRGDARVTMQVSPTGDLVFQSSSGLHGKGRMTDVAGKVTASVTATSPLNADGRPVFGASEIVFDITGDSRAGLITGSYKSIVETGNFVLCNSDARKNPEINCDTLPAGDPLKGILNGLKALSGR